MNPSDTPILGDDERTRCEVWTRVMGYHRPVSAFNFGKRSEHRERQYFTECAAGTAERTIERAAWDNGMDPSPFTDGVGSAGAVDVNKT